jgi:hypothetical protein
VKLEERLLAAAKQLERSISLVTALLDAYPDAESFRDAVNSFAADLREASSRVQGEGKREEDQELSSSRASVCGASAPPEPLHSNGKGEP